MRLDGIKYNEAWATGKTFEEFCAGVATLVASLPEAKREVHLKNAYELLNPKPKRTLKPKKEEDGNDNGNVAEGTEFQPEP
jgi:hypothetical protein